MMIYWRKCLSNDLDHESLLEKLIKRSDSLRKKKKKIQNMIVKGIELKTDVKSGNAAATADRQIVLAARADAE